MKKATRMLVLLAVLSLLGFSFAHAGTTDTISVTVTLENISISLDTGTWAIGTVAAGSVNTSSAYTVTNDGNVAEDIAIQTADSASWTSEAASGVDQFVMDAQGGDLGTGGWTNIDASQTLITGLAAAGTVADLKLRFTCPAAGSNVSQQTIVVTLTASKN